MEAKYTTYDMYGISIQSKSWETYFKKRCMTDFFVNISKIRFKLQKK